MIRLKTISLQGLNLLWGWTIPLHIYYLHIDILCSASVYAVMAQMFPFTYTYSFLSVTNILLFQVMDYNINLGKHLLPLVVQVLKYCSCPQLRHYFQQPPRCSLWSLKPHIRQMWLKALLVILYKVSGCAPSGGVEGCFENTVLGGSLTDEDSMR